MRKRHSDRVADVALIGKSAFTRIVVNVGLLSGHVTRIRRFVYNQSKVTTGKFISRLERFQNNSRHWLVRCYSGHLINRIFCAVVQTHLTMGLLGHAQPGYAIYRDIKRSKFIFIGFCCNLVDMRRVSNIYADDRQQIPSAFDHQRGVWLFQIRRFDRAIRRVVKNRTICICVFAYLPDKIVANLQEGAGIPCGGFCGVGCIGEHIYHLRVIQVHHPVLALFHRLTCKGVGFSHGFAKDRRTDRRCVTGGVLKLHLDIIAPNGVKLTLFIVYFSVKFWPFARVCVFSPCDLANVIARFIKLTCCGVIGTGAPSGKRPARRGVNTQRLRGFQRTGFVIQHVRARRVVLIYIFLAAYTVVDHIGNALFIAGNVAVAVFISLNRVHPRASQCTLVHIVGGVALFFSGSGFGIRAICNDPDTAACSHIIDIAVFDMVQAQLKVDAIGELVPIVVAVIIPEPVRPCCTVICGHLHIHIAADASALIAVSAFTIVIRSAVHIQPVALVPPVQVDGNVIVSIHLASSHILVCVHGRCRFFPAKSGIRFVTAIAPRIFDVISSGIFQNLGVHQFSTGFHFSVPIHHIHGFNVRPGTCKLQLLFVDVDEISNALFASNGKLKAYRIGVSTAHGSLAGVCHLNSQRDVKVLLPIYVKFALSLLPYYQIKLRLLLFRVSSIFVIHPLTFVTV